MTSSVETDISSFSLDKLQKGFLPRELQLPPDFPTLEDFLNMKRVEEFREPTRTLLESRFSANDVALGMIGFELMAELHNGRKRKYSDAEEATHPALISIWNLILNPDAGVDEYVFGALHDTIEDCQVDQTGVERRLTGKKYPPERAIPIAKAVEGVSRDDPDDQIGFLNKIFLASQDTEIAKLHPVRVKLIDTTHVSLCFTRELGDPNFDAGKAERYRNKKALTTLAWGQMHAPDTLNYHILNKVVIGLNDALGHRRQQDHAASRKDYPTAHVPA